MISFGEFFLTIETTALVLDVCTLSLVSYCVDRLLVILLDGYHSLFFTRCHVAFVINFTFISYHVAVQLPIFHWATIPVLARSTEMIPWKVGVSVWNKWRAGNIVIMMLQLVKLSLLLGVAARLFLEVIMLCVVEHIEVESTISSTRTMVACATGAAFTTLASCTWHGKNM